MNHIALLIIRVTLLMLFPGIFTALVYAAAGGLDPTFGSSGKIQLNVGASVDEALAVAIQPDRKIVVVGRTNNGSRMDTVLLRYNEDGSLDPSFDGDGKIVADLGSENEDGATAFAIQPDGKIVIVGFANFQVLLARYNEAGRPDPSFGSDGKITDSDWSGSAAVVAIQPDGKLIVAGEVSEGERGYLDFMLARYNSDGSPDSSFGSNGKITTDFNQNFDYGNALALQPDGKIVVAGTAYKVLNPDFALARYNPDGSLDPSFDGDGKVTTNLNGGWDFAQALILQPDGKLVVAGNSSGQFALARYNSNGSLDTSFDGDGSVITDFGAGFEWVSALARQSTGELLVGGTTDTAGSGSADFALARYHEDGGLDASFGVDGKVTTDFSKGEDMIQDLALQADGKIVAVGYADLDGDAKFAIARYQNDWSPPVLMTRVFLPLVIH